MLMLYAAVTMWLPAAFWQDVSVEEASGDWAEAECVIKAKEVTRHCLRTAVLLKVFYAVGQGTFEPSCEHRAEFTVDAYVDSPSSRVWRDAVAYKYGSSRAQGSAAHAQRFADSVEIGSREPCWVDAAWGSGSAVRVKLSPKTHPSYWTMVEGWAVTVASAMSAMAVIALGLWSTDTASKGSSLSRSSSGIQLMRT